QFLSAGTEFWKETLADALLAATGLTRLYERSDSGVRQLEGLAPVKGWLRGGGDTEVELQESSWRLKLDVAEGHKTGYYLDQRDNRRDFATWVRQLGAQRVLNCFSYTGGFSVAALAGGATEVISVDSSGPALARANEHVLLNGFNPAHHQALDADVNTTLRQFAQEGRQFDAIVLDPPKYAPSSAHAEKASRAYRDINRLGLKLLAPGGLLTTYS
ncbi:MAG: class I SAM-dependent rRNA methyltransferase, partial [Inhella sp.]